MHGQNYIKSGFRNDRPVDVYMLLDIGFINIPTERILFCSSVSIDSAVCQLLSVIRITIMAQPRLYTTPEGNLYRGRSSVTELVT